MKARFEVPIFTKSGFFYIPQTLHKAIVKGVFIFSQGAFSMGTTLRLGMQMLEAIEGCHNLSYIHRDIKPVCALMARSIHCYFASSIECLVFLLLLFKIYYYYFCLLFPKFSHFSKIFILAFFPEFLVFLTSKNHGPKLETPIWSSSGVFDHHLNNFYNVHQAPQSKDLPLEPHLDDTSTIIDF